MAEGGGGGGGGVSKCVSATLTCEQLVRNVLLFELRCVWLIGEGARRAEWKLWKHSWFAYTQTKQRHGVPELVQGAVSFSRPQSFLGFAATP